MGQTDYSMDLGEIKSLKEAVINEEIGIGEIAKIDQAFNMLVAAGASLRDDPENATTLDKLEELEDHATTVEKVIYDWVERMFGESEAKEPSWSTSLLAKEINQIQVISGAEDSKLGRLLGEE